MHTKEGTGTEAEWETNGAEPETFFNRMYFGVFIKSFIIYGLGGANKVRDGIGGGMGNERDGI